MDDLKVPVRFIDTFQSLLDGCYYLTLPACLGVLLPDSYYHVALYLIVPSPVDKFSDVLLLDPQ